MGTEWFSPKFTFPNWFYYLVVSYFTYYLEKPVLRWHQFALVIIETVTLHVPIRSNVMLWDPKSNIVQITSFIPYWQIECSKGLTISQIWHEKLAGARRVFLFVVLWQAMALKMAFENHSLFIFTNKHGIMWQWYTQCVHRIGVIAKHWELPKSIRFSNCHHETQHTGSRVMVFRVQWDLLKKVLAATSHWKGKRLRESQCHHRVTKRLPVSKLSSRVSYIQQFHIHLALSLKLPSIILSGKAMKSRGIIPWRHNVKVKKTGGKRKHISAHLSVLKGVRGTRK